MNGHLDSLPNMALHSSVAECVNLFAVLDLAAAAAATLVPAVASFSGCLSTRERANPVAVRLHHRWRATLLRPMASPRSSSTRGFLIYMLPHLLVLYILMSIQTWLCFLLSLNV